MPGAHLLQDENFLAFFMDVPLNRALRLMGGVEEGLEPLMTAINRQTR